MPDNLKAFTLRADGLLRVLTTQIQVLPVNIATVQLIEAIWDTGATNTVITTKVVQALGLIPAGMTNMQTANGAVLQSTYLVDIILPNGVKIESMAVSECQQLSGGCDALIGMDIIGIGDFSVTNHNGKTCMSFRVPSCHTVDYVERPNAGIKENKPAGSQGSNRAIPKKKKRK